VEAKLLILTAIAALCVAPPTFAKHRIVQTRHGREVVVNTHGHDSPRSHFFWNVGIGFPFSAGYYAGYPYYGGYYSDYPYYGSYDSGYPYGYSYNSYGYNNYYSSTSPYSYNQYANRDYDSVVIRVQQRLARAGYYRGPIDGVIGPRTRYAILAYERNHGLPADGVIGNRFLRTMGLLEPRRTFPN
jgi:putative peptidoglycan binding protein